MLALLVATAIAFVVTERQKLEKSPISSTHVGRYLAPLCRCRRSVATVSFRLRPADSVTVQIVDRDDTVVRELLRRTRFGKRAVVRAEWDGRAAGGSLAPDGLYRARVRLAGKGRTFLLPNRIRLDTAPPRVTIVRARPPVVSPNGDRFHRRLGVDYSLSEPAYAVLYVNGRLRLRMRGTRTTGRFWWYPQPGLKPGRYRIQVAARDLSGNLGHPTPPVLVRVRYGGAAV